MRQLTLSSFLYSKYNEGVTQSVLPFLTHSFALNGLRDPSTDRTATMSGYKCTSFLQSHNQLNHLPHFQLQCTPILCVPDLYTLQLRQETPSLA